MAIIILLVVLLAALVQLVCAIFVYIHAFQQSVGTGFLVLCVPCYIFFYIHDQFQHEHKQTIVTLFYASIAVNVVMRMLGMAIGRGSY